MAWKISKTQDFYSSETLISWKIFRIAGIIFYALILFISLMSHLAFPMTNPRFNAYAFLERLTTKIETFRVFLTLSTDSFMNKPGSSLINSQMFWNSIIFPDFLWKFGLNLAWQTTTVCGLIKFFIYLFSPKMKYDNLLVISHMFLQFSNTPNQSISLLNSFIAKLCLKWHIKPSRYIKLWDTGSPFVLKERLTLPTTECVSICSL